MNRDIVIQRLKESETTLRAYGVQSLYLFGSFARNDATDESDIDVFVDASDPSFYSLEGFTGAYSAIQNAFPGRDVGYGTRQGLSRHIRAAVEENAIRIF
jgi:predicted nucleotidyltransferase